MSGFYRIFDPQEFAKGRKTLVWGGMWKSDRKDPKFICDFLKRYSELSPKVIKFIEQFRIFLAPIDAHKRIMERIESEIASSLNKQKGIVGRFQDKDVRYKPRRQNERQIRVTMAFPKSIMGLKEVLVV